MITPFKGPAFISSTLILVLAPLSIILASVPSPQPKPAPVFNGANCWGVFEFEEEDWHWSCFSQGCHASCLPGVSSSQGHSGWTTCLCNGAESSCCHLVYTEHAEGQFTFEGEGTCTEGDPCYEDGGECEAKVRLTSLDPWIGSVYAECTGT